MHHALTPLQPTVHGQDIHAPHSHTRHHPTNASQRPHSRPAPCSAWASCRGWRCTCQTAGRRRQTRGCEQPGPRPPPPPPLQQWQRQQGPEWSGAAGLAKANNGCQQRERWRGGLGLGWPQAAGGLECASRPPPAHLRPAPAAPHRPLQTRTPAPTCRCRVAAWPRRAPSAARQGEPGRQAGRCVGCSGVDAC